MPSTLAIVIPNYNHAAYLPEAIESILGQTRQPDEFWILDDASTDNSLEVIEAYAAKHPFIQVVRQQPNQGVHAAHRRLFELVKSDYVLAMAADDMRYPQCLELAMGMAEKYPQAGLIIGQMAVTVDGQEAGIFGVDAWREPTFATPERYLREFLMRELPSHSLVGSTIFRREPFREVGWYRDELGSWGDTFAAFAIGLKHGVCYVPEPFAEWRKLSDSYSQLNLANPRKTLDMINRAACLMRSPAFRARFPEHYVRTWRRRYIWLTIKEHWRGDHTRELPAGASLVTRYRYRLPRTWEALSLLWHKTDLSTLAQP